MKIISNFELLFAPIAPIQNGAIARRVSQGHFLTIANTELHRSVYYKVRYFFGNTIGANGVNRELNSANHVLIYDGGSINNQIITSSISQGVNIPGGDYFCLSTENLRLRAGETGLLALLPNIGPLLNNTNPQLEIRGFITIEQVSDAVYVNSANQTIKETNPFTHETAKVLITSEHRGTFLDSDFPFQPEPQIFGVRFGYDFDQLAYSLPLAEGKSLYELPGA